MWEDSYAKFFVSHLCVYSLSCSSTVGHQFINKWAMLSIPGDLSTGVKGYVKCDISISAKGETIQPGPKASDAEEQIDKYILSVFYVTLR